jgi:hypothetical protein
MLNWRRTTGKARTGPMSDASQGSESTPAAAKAVGEWFWRFLAVVMLAVLGWVVWIAYQINPPPLVTASAFEAAAKARAARNVQGVIAPAVPAAAAAAAKSQPPEAQLFKPESPAQAAASEPRGASGAAEARPPPVNVEKLKLSDSIGTPIPERANKK